MKRVIVYIVLIIIFTSLGLYGFFNKPKELPPKTILGNTYYSFNKNNGDYDEIKIDENKVSYIGDLMDLTDCSDYEYKESTGILKLSCGTSFKLDAATETGIMLEVNGINEFFYSDKENSYKVEFQKHFNTDINSYKIQGLSLVNTLKTNYEKLLEMSSSSNINFVYLSTPKCSNECIIFNHTFMKFTNTNNKYYLPLDNLNKESIKDFKNKFNYDLTDKENPQVIVFKDGKVLEIIDIEAKTFDLSKYEGFGNNYGVENEENN